MPKVSPLSAKLMGYAELATNTADTRMHPKRAQQRHILATAQELFPGLKIHPTEMGAFVRYAMAREWKSPIAKLRVALNDRAHYAAHISVRGAPHPSCGCFQCCLTRKARGEPTKLVPGLKGGKRKGAGRPPDDEKATNRTVRLRPSTWELLARLAAARGTSRQVLISDLAEAEALRVKEER